MHPSCTAPYAPCVHLPHVQARLLGGKGKKPVLNVEECTLECGDGKPFDLRDDSVIQNGI